MLLPHLLWIELLQRKGAPICRMLQWLTLMLLSYGHMVAVLVHLGLAKQAFLCSL